MILVSLSPLRLRRCLSSLVACAGITATYCFAQSIFYPVESTPYDNQMARVQPVLASSGGAPAEEVSLAIVNRWINKLRRVPYRYSKQWMTPFEVSTTKTADCKGKAITLYEVMQAIGAKDVRLVIGKHRAGDWFTHAWLEWETADGNYVLDPTFNWRAVKAEQQSSRKYLPLYAYEGVFAYRAVSATLVSETLPHAVASGR
jgi:predicted transglutaminase-like cysteine proteinase